MAMRREGKKVAFQDGSISLKTRNIRQVFYLIFTITYSRKNEFRFSKQNTCKLKDLKLFKVLWTTY